MGASDSGAFVEAASVGTVGSAAGAAVTVTEAGGVVVEMGRKGATPWGRRGGGGGGGGGGGATPGGGGGGNGGAKRGGGGGRGARPGMLRGGRDARPGTGGGEKKRCVDVNFCKDSYYHTTYCYVKDTVPLFWEIPSFV